MSSNPISLSDLKAKRAAMRADQHHDRYTNAVTLVLEASDDLIEVAEAALAFRKAERGAAVAHFAWVRSAGAPDDIVRRDAAKEAGRLVEQLRDALDAALAKIKP